MIYWDSTKDLPFPPRPWQSSSFLSSSGFFRWDSRTLKNSFGTRIFCPEPMTHPKGEPFCWYCWWFRNPVNSPVDMVSLSHSLQGFCTIPGGCLGFLPSTGALSQPGDPDSCHVFSAPGACSPGESKTSLATPWQNAGEAWDGWHSRYSHGRKEKNPIQRCWRCWSKHIWKHRDLY